MELIPKLTPKELFVRAFATVLADWPPEHLLRSPDAGGLRVFEVSLSDVAPKHWQCPVWELTLGGKHQFSVTVYSERRGNVPDSAFCRFDVEESAEVVAPVEEVGTYFVPTRQGSDEDAFEFDLRIVHPHLPDAPSERLGKRRIRFKAAPQPGFCIAGCQPPCVSR